MLPRFHDEHKAVYAALLKLDQQQLLSLLSFDVIQRAKEIQEVCNKAFYFHNS